jgi:hypothetical protein
MLGKSLRSVDLPKRDGSSQSGFYKEKFHNGGEAAGSGSYGGAAIVVAQNLEVVSPLSRGRAKSSMTLRPASWYSRQPL